MKALLTLLTVLTFGRLAAQTHEIEIKNTSKEEVVLPGTIKKTLKNNQNYAIKLLGVNSANISLKVQGKSLELYSPAPDALKGVLPGVSGSFHVNTKGGVGKPLADDSVLNTEIQSKLDKFRDIKSEAEKLYTATKFDPDILLAKKALKKINKKYGFVSADKAANNQVAQIISNDIYYINTAQEVFAAVIKGQFSMDPEMVKSYANLNAVVAELNKHNYFGFYEYLVNSTTAVNFVKSKSFKPTKDLMELKFTIVDVFKKDTLVNETKTVFSNGGGWGLSFSTGFFYTEMLSDQPYNLSKQPDATMLIVKDKRIVSDISIGAMAHLYYKISPELRLGPSIGIAVSPFDGKSRYLLGGSILAGREKMLGISVGKALAKTKYLSSSVQGTSPNFYLPAGATAIPTYDRISNVWFIGLSYNLISTRK